MSDIKEKILHFWFVESQPEQWFMKNDDFDRTIIDRFTETYNNAADGQYDSWQDDPEGCVALCIVLDQFPRNMFRGSPKSFATDERALQIAKHAVSKGFDMQVAVKKRGFLYLPYEHSEDLNDQRKSVELYSKMKAEDPLGYDYALRHLEVIEQFGRFPHRNVILGRKNTAEEDIYLSRPGAGF